jgi:hypothetical protein
MRHVVAMLLAAACTASAQPPVPATLAGRSTIVLKKPLQDEPIRGFSSINLREDGTYWLLGDTGHAARARRRDVIVAFHHVFVDWIHGKANLLSVEPLADPDHRLPFRIVNEATRERLLTTADLNVDAMRIVDERAWLADDLGPYLVQTTLGGRVLAAYRAPYEAAAVRRGFGALAASSDARLLYAAFEGKLWDVDASRRETGADGAEYARILEFDIAARRWTGRVWRYAFDANGNSIADLTMLDARHALVVERGAGARRIYRAVLGDGALVKQSFVDLAPFGLAGVEGVEVIEGRYIALSDGERPDLVLLRAPLLLLPTLP